MKILDFDEKKIEFYRNKIIGKLNRLKDGISKEKYDYFCAIVNGCEDFSSLREMADLDMQIDYVNYVRNEIVGELNRRSLTSEDVSMIQQEEAVEADIQIIVKPKKKAQATYNDTENVEGKDDNSSVDSNFAMSRSEILQALDDDNMMDLAASMIYNMVNQGGLDEDEVDEPADPEDAGTWNDVLDSAREAETEGEYSDSEYGIGDELSEELDSIDDMDFGEFEDSEDFEIEEEGYDDSDELIEGEPKVDIEGLKDKFIDNDDYDLLGTDDEGEDEEGDWDSLLSDVADSDDDYSDDDDEDEWDEALNGLDDEDSDDEDSDDEDSDGEDEDLDEGDSWDSVLDESESVVDTGESSEDNEDTDEEEESWDSVLDEDFDGEYSDTASSEDESEDDWDSLLGEADDMESFEDISDDPLADLDDIFDDDDELEGFEKDDETTGEEDELDSALDEFDFDDDEGDSDDEDSDDSDDEDSDDFDSVLSGFDEIDDFVDTEPNDSESDEPGDDFDSILDGLDGLDDVAWSADESTEANETKQVNVPSVKNTVVPVSAKPKHRASSNLFTNGTARGQETQKMFNMLLGFGSKSSSAGKKVGNKAKSGAKRFLNSDLFKF